MKGGNLSNNQLSNVETKRLDNFTGILTLEKVAYAWNIGTTLNTDEYTLSQISSNEAELADYNAVLYHSSFSGNTESLRTDSYSQALSFYPDRNNKTFVVFYLYDPRINNSFSYIKMAGRTIINNSDGTYQVSGTEGKLFSIINTQPNINTQNLSLANIAYAWENGTDAYSSNDGTNYVLLNNSISTNSNTYNCEEDISPLYLNDTNNNSIAFLNNITHYQNTIYDNDDDNSPNAENTFRFYNLNGLNSYMYVQNTDFTPELSFVFKMTQNINMTILNSRNLRIDYETPNTIKIFKVNNYVNNATLEGTLNNVSINTIYRLKIVNNTISLTHIKFWLKNNSRFIVINRTSGALSTYGYRPSASEALFELVPSNQTNKYWLKSNSRFIVINSTSGTVATYNYRPSASNALFEIVPSNQANRYRLKNNNKFIYIDSSNAVVSTPNAQNINALFELVPSNNIRNINVTGLANSGEHNNIYLGTNANKNDYFVGNIGYVLLNTVEPSPTSAPAPAPTTATVPQINTQITNIDVSTNRYVISGLNPNIVIEGNTQRHPLSSITKSGNDVIYSLSDTIPQANSFSRDVFFLRLGNIRYQYNVNILITTSTNPTSTSTSAPGPTSTNPTSTSTSTSTSASGPTSSTVQTSSSTVQTSSSTVQTTSAPTIQTTNTITSFVPTVTTISQTIPSTTALQNITPTTRVKLIFDATSVLSLRTKIFGTPLVFSPNDTIGDKIVKLQNSYQSLQNTVMDFNFPTEVIHQHFNSNIYTHINNNNYFSFIITVNNQTIQEIDKVKCMDTNKIKNYLEQNHHKLYLFVFSEKLILGNKAIPKNAVVAVCHQENENSPFKYEQVGINHDFVYNYVFFEIAKKIIQNQNVYPSILNQINSNYNLGPNFVNSISINNNNVLNLSVNTRVYQYPLNTEIAQFYISQINNNYINACKFNPMGDTIYDCQQKCISNKCSEIECKQLCENCENLNCKWNVKDFNFNNRLKPEPCIIKGFSGNKIIKVTWIRPDSKSDINKYYIIVLSNISNYFEIYVSDDQRELLDFYITNLQNDIPYDVIIYSRNEYGVSKKSNIETIIPSETSELKEIKRDTYDNSLQNVYQLNNEQESNQNISNFEKQVAYNDLKDILIKDLSFKIPKGNYNINIL